jgi:hypothetical protein
VEVHWCWGHLKVDLSALKRKEKQFSNVFHTPFHTPTINTVGINLIESTTGQTIHRSVD